MTQVVVRKCFFFLFSFLFVFILTICNQINNLKFVGLTECGALHQFFARWFPLFTKFFAMLPLFRIGTVAQLYFFIVQFSFGCHLTLGHLAMFFLAMEWPLLSVTQIDGRQLAKLFFQRESCQDPLEGIELSWILKKLPNLELYKSIEIDMVVIQYIQYIQGTNVTSQILGFFRCIFRAALYEW